MLTLIYTLMLSATLGGGSVLDTPKGGFKAGSDPDKYEMGIVKGAGIDGKDAATIYATGKVRNMGFGTLMQTISADKYVGKRIRLTGYIKSKDVQEWAGLWLRIDAGRASVGFDNMEDRAVKGTTDWKQYELVLDVPEGSTDINYGALVTRTGQIWFDQMKLEVVDNTVALTGEDGGSLYAPKPTNLNFTEMWPKGRTYREAEFPSSWFWNANSYRDGGFIVGMEKGGAKEKGNAIKLHSNEKTKGWCSFYQKIEADDYRNKRVKVTAWIKTQDVKKHAGLWMTVYGIDTKRKPLSFDYMWDKKRNIKGTTSWTKYEVVLDIPKDAYDINYGVQLTQPGQAWVSDVTFEVVDASVPLTGKSPKVFLEIPEPVNLDFDE